MAEPLTQKILRRIELAKTVGAGIDALLDDAVAGFDEFLAPVVADGEPPVDVRQQLVLLRRKTDAHVEALQGIDLGVFSRTSDKDFVKNELDELTPKVIVKLRRVADVASGVYGKEFLPAIGLSGVIGRVPLRLYERGRRAQTILKSPDLQLRPKAGFVLGADGETNAFSPLALADELEPELTDLGLLVDTRFAGDGGQTAARRRRDRAVEEFDLGMGGIVRIVQGMLLAAGRKDLASQLATRRRRVARQQSQGQQGESEQSQSQQGEGQGSSQPVDPSTSTP